jgi:hypothetical protein
MQKITELRRPIQRRCQLKTHNEAALKYKNPDSLVLKQAHTNFS